jgi:hypothetical protein
MTEIEQRDVTKVPHAKKFAFDEIVAELASVDGE